MPSTTSSPGSEAPAAAPPTPRTSTPPGIPVQDRPVVDRPALDAGDGPSSLRGGAHARRAELCRRIDHRFGDDTLLELALRHRSWCSEHGGVESNERLEFLGDSVLGLVVTEHLFAGSPTSSEGVLA